MDEPTEVEDLRIELAEVHGEMDVLEARINALQTVIKALVMTIPWQHAKLTAFLEQLQADEDAAKRDGHIAGWSQMEDIRASVEPLQWMVSGGKLDS